MFDFLKTVRSPEHRLAWPVAIAADAIQIGVCRSLLPVVCHQRTRFLI